MARRRQSIIGLKALIRYEYTVHEGDTLADVLRISGASVRELMALNTRCNLLSLQSGQRLRLPRAARSCARTYRVRKDEDIYTLSRKFGSSVVSLLKNNPDLRPNEIQRGARIALPEE